MILSVIVPAYDAERYVGECLESVLGQEPRPLEVLVVDDGSTDETARIVRRCPQVRLVQQSNQGAAAARNAGVAASRGDVLAFLDADDLWYPGAIQTQLAYLEANPETGFIYGLLENFQQADAQKEGYHGWYEVGDMPRVFATTALTVRRPVWEDVGLFDPAMVPREDLDWFVRAEEAGHRGEQLTRWRVRRRIHDRNLSHVSREEHMRLNLMVVSAALQRKRHRANVPSPEARGRS